MSNDSQSETISEYIGQVVTVVLANNATYTGTVFTYSPARCLLALMTDCGQPRPTIRSFNTRFIQSLEVIEKNPKKDDRLPHDIGQGAQLPPLNADASDTLQKKTNKALKAADDQRKQQSGLALTIHACDVFTQLSKIFNEVVWSTKDNDFACAYNHAGESGPPPADHAPVMIVQKCIVVSGNVGSFTWRNPCVVQLKEDGPDTAGFLTRVQKVAATAVTNQNLKA